MCLLGTWMLLLITDLNRILSQSFKFPLQGHQVPSSFALYRTLESTYLMLTVLEVFFAVFFPDLRISIVEDPTISVNPILL